MTARYVLCPGYARSAKDGDLHFVDARTLRSLYGVAEGDYLTMPAETPGRPGGGGLRAWVQEAIDLGQLVPLHPQLRREDYVLPPPPAPVPSLYDPDAP